MGPALPCPSSQSAACDPLATFSTIVPMEEEPRFARLTNCVIVG